MEVCLLNTMTERRLHLWNKCSALCHLTVFFMYIPFRAWKLYREQLHICFCVLINNDGEQFLDDVAAHEFTQVKPIVAWVFKVSKATLQLQSWYKIFMWNGPSFKKNLSYCCETEHWRKFYHSIAGAWWEGNNELISTTDLRSTVAFYWKTEIELACGAGHMESDTNKSPNKYVASANQIAVWKQQRPLGIIMPYGFRRAGNLLKCAAASFCSIQTECWTFWRFPSV